MSSAAAKLRLVLHPDTPQSAVRSIDIEAVRRPDGYLSLSYWLNGVTDQVVWPGWALSGSGPWDRSDRLWESTCFEVFGTSPGEQGYFEVNLSTVGKWAAYAFYDRRLGMRDADDITIGAANWRIRPHRAELHALLQIPPAYEARDWLLGLSAVLEAKDGTKSYWALAHPAGKPDFHHPDCFVLELPAARRG